MKKVRRKWQMSIWRVWRLLTGVLMSLGDEGDGVDFRRFFFVIETVRAENAQII